MASVDSLVHSPSPFVVSSRLRGLPRLSPNEGLPFSFSKLRICESESRVFCYDHWKQTELLPTLRLIETQVISLYLDSYVLWDTGAPSISYSQAHTRNTYVSTAFLPSFFVNFS